jgi:hypothetical protein
VEARHNFTNRGYRFIVNTHDVMPGTGDVKLTRTDKDATFLSFMTNLHMHMRAKYVLLNCDSNYHQLLSKIVRGSAGLFVMNPQIFCMQNQVRGGELSPHAPMPLPIGSQSWRRVWLAPLIR